MGINNLISTPIEFLAKINGKPKPFLKTWLLLKTRNRCSHYTDYSKQYPQIAKSINVSISTLRSHVKQMVYEGFATIENDKLRLVSKWRNPISYKTREYTKGHYGKLSKTTINPHNLKLEVFQYQLKQQITRQNYRASQKLKFKKPISRANQIKNQLLDNIYQNGVKGKILKDICENELIQESDRTNVFDMQVRGLKLVCEAVSHKLALNEGKEISKSASLSLNKISEITGYASPNSLRAYKTALKENSGLIEERNVSKKVIGKKFVPHYHFKDKFGNIFRKECIRYEVGTKEIQVEVSIHKRKAYNIPCI